MKIITKIMANRLKRFLHSLISPNQAAFIPGRLIQDSILVAHEGFHFLKQKKRGRQVDLALKLDFNKAYDRLQWDYLKAVLQKMGFHDRWICWVMECVTTVKFSIFANGEKRASFTPSCGLRQGDPLSPYLFVLVAETLSKLIETKVRANKITGLKMRRTCPVLSHLFFADDVLLFFKATLLEGMEMAQTLQVYSSASGQRLNFAKSEIFFSANAPPDLKGQICELLGTPLARPHTTYLGLPSWWGRSKAAAYGFLVDRMVSKMQGWKNKLLSHAGREVLLKAVVQAIPSYAMACFAFPKSFGVKVNRAIRNFWWKGDPMNRGIPWASWESMSVSKLHGGLGFRDFFAFNQAMLAKQGWRLITNPQSYWAQLFKGLYFPHTHFLTATFGARPSWAWTSLLKGRDLLKKGMRWQVQNGESIQFWDDKWIPTAPNFQLSSAKPPCCDIVTASNAIDPIRKQWKLEAFQHCLSSDECHAIQLIPISMGESEDRLVWHHTKSGQYSVKSGYWVAKTSTQSNSPSQPSSSFQVPAGFWKRLWSIKAPPKLKHFWWRACKNLLASKVNLHRRRCSPSKECPVCLKDDESVEHLLFDCPWTQTVWFGSLLNIRIEKGSVVNIAEWTTRWMQPRRQIDDQDSILSKSVFIGWHIWKARNAFLFNQVPINPMDTIAKITQAWKEYQEHCHNGQSAHSEPSVPALMEAQGWQPAPSGTYKINCDASFNIRRSTATAAAVMRDSAGRVIDGSVSSFPASSAFVAEAYAVRMAAMMAQSCGLTSIFVESDCQQVIQLGVGEQVPPWEGLAILLDIRHLIRVGNLHLQWTTRKNNQVANWVAQTHACNLLPLDWVANPPAALAALLSADVPLSLC